MCDLLRGLIAAPHTPFDDQGDVNLPAIERQIDWLTKSGVSGAYVCGTTGEGMSMTVAERKAVAEHWARHAGDRLKVIIHVGHLSQREAIDLARHADKLDVYSISAIAPCFFRPTNVQTLVDYLAPIAAVSSKPFYYYHSPGMTGVDVSLVELADRTRQAIPTFAGIKYNSGDLFAYQQALTIEDVDVPFGTDELLLPALSVGASSAIGSTYNFAAPLYTALWQAHDRGDLETARGYAQKAVALVRLLCEYGVLPAGKAIMSLRGVECGDPRSPVAALSSEQKQSLFQRVHELGVLDEAVPEPASI